MIWNDNTMIDEALEQLKKIVEQENEFIITSHVRPDGDSIATQIALAYALKQLNKKVTIINKDPVPMLYKFLPGTDMITTSKEIPEQPRVVFYIECSDEERPELKILGKHFIVNIDHHITNTMYGDLNWINSSSPAAGAMIYDFLQIMNITLTKEIAENIYAAIAADTGGFRYNLSANTFCLCQEMIKTGIKAETANKNLFGNYPATRVKLLAEVLATLQFDAKGKVVWIVLTDEMLTKTGAAPIDAEGFIDCILFIEGVEMELFFKQIGNSGVRVSLRSSGNIDVSPIAREYGGGGHKYASACSLPGTMGDAIIQFLQRLKQFYEKEL
jgi:phosphoesterase RecJ-like protein